MTNIRHATIDDAHILTQIARQSFEEAFGDHPKNTPEDLKSYMDKAFTIEVFSAELADKNIIYFVAEIDGRIGGYAKLKQNSFEEGVSGRQPIELCRIYNLQEFISKGIGKALLLEGLEFAEANRHDIIWLGVWEENIRAQNFYTKFGFEKCGEQSFKLGNDLKINWVMQRSVN